MKFYKYTVALSAVCFSIVMSHAQTERQVENIYAFAKVYGYVKYFHPSDEAASIDWNRFLMYGAEKVSGSKDAGELKANLEQLFKPIAPTIQILSQKEPGSFNKEVLIVPGSKNYKIIAWQHNGVGLGRSDVYQSLRTSRAAPAAKAPEFAPMSSWIDAKALQGKEFIFTGKMRMVNGDGKAQLWVRVDRTNKGMGFFDNMGDRPVKSTDWKEYEIKGQIDADAASMVMGVMLLGKGEMEFDDFALKVKEGSEWKELYQESFTNVKDRELPKGLYWNAAQTTYVYSVKKPGNDQSIASIKFNETEAGTKKHDALFSALPKIGEYIDKKIGSDIRLIMPIALYGSATQTFPVADTAALLTLKQQINAIPAASITADDLYTRLAGLAITWNVFQHFYPYFDVVKINWDAALKQSIAEAWKDKTASEFQETLQKLTAQLKDGHVRVNSSTNKAVFLPGIAWEWIEDELVITFVGDSVKGLQKGDLVKTIDGQPARLYFENIYPRISAGTKGWLDYRANTESLLGEKNTIMNLGVLKNDKISETPLTRSFNYTKYYELFPKPDSIKWIAPDIAYINLDAAPMSLIDSSLPELEKARVIICDLRGYPNANHKLLSYLLKEKDTSKRWMQVPQFIYPDQEKIAAWQYHGWEMKPAKPHLNAKIIFLTGGQAISYAESYMGFVEHYKLATIIGQPTAGANGNINPFTIPGGYNITWTGMRVVKHDGSTHHTKGIEPHIKVNKTIKGVREGRDEYLEKALEVSKKTF